MDGEGLMNCKICSATATPVFNKRILFKYEVAYYQCSACGFLFTEEPYWLNEAYDETIKGIRDVGMVQRNLQVADLTERLIVRYLNPKGTFIDYGAGTGLLVRIMRDRGFDFFYDDPYARNIFARCFEATKQSESAVRYELLTAFEVYEHSANPLEDVQRMLAYSDSILFTTELQPKSAEQLEGWFYLFPDAGQHVAFHTLESLRNLAGLFALKLHTDGENTHLMTRRDLDFGKAGFTLWNRSFVSRLASWGARKMNRLAGAPPPMASLVSKDSSYVNNVLKKKAGETNR